MRENREWARDEMAERAGMKYELSRVHSRENSLAANFGADHCRIFKVVWCAELKAFLALFFRAKPTSEYDVDRFRATTSEKFIELPVCRRQATP
jgi:hypothetical protein